MKTILVLAAACGALLLSACNTVEGAGRDLEQAGDALQRSANR